MTGRLDRGSRLLVADGGGAHPDARTAAPGAPRAPGGSSVRPWPWWVLPACVALAVVTLLLPSVPTYDPWAWLIWGREIAHGDLATTGGPSWKPFPVLFTTPFSLLGDEVAPRAWLVVARAGGIVAVVVAHRSAARLAGPAAGLIAAAALVLSDGFVFNVARGNSEGVLVAAALLAVERHRDGRPLQALLLGVVAALLRPEVWPILVVYAVVLVRHDRSRRVVVTVAVSAVAILAMWFVPEQLGSGDLLRAVSRARQPNADAAAFDAHPFLSVFRRSAPVLGAAVYVGAAAAVIGALRRRDRSVLGLAAATMLLMVTVATMTEAGFAGNLRYVALPAAIVCVLAGIGWVELARAAARRGGAAAVGAAAIAVLALLPVRDDVRTLSRDVREVADEAALDGEVPAVIAAAGGRAAVLGCGTVFTGAFQTQVVAWHLGVHQADVDVDTTPSPPGTVIAPSRTAMSRDADFPTIGRSDHWTVGSSCD